MPYIHEEDRGLDPTTSPGHLNFYFSSMINYYLIEHGLSYENINAVIGALECAKLECYRRIAAPYEQGKQLLNGDVYDPELIKKL